MWPDFDTAMEVIDMYVDNNLEKPNASMTKNRFMFCCDQLNAVDILKRYMKKHWGEAPGSDIVYNFVKKQSRLMKTLKDDVFQKTTYEVVKDIFYYFI